MFSLIRREFILHKKLVIIMGICYPLYLGFFGSRINQISLLGIFSGFLYAFVPIILFSREDKFKSLAFGLSLPVTRREYLRARFLLSWGLILLMYAFGSLLMIAVPGTKLSAATVFAPRMILLSLAFMAVCFGFIMPFFTRFGFVGILVLSVILQVFGILFLIFRSPAVFDLIKKIFKLIPNGFAAIQASLGPAAAFAAGLALLALFSYASFAVSLALFKKKEF